MATKIYGGRWEVVRQHGEGGQAFVYLVRDTIEEHGGEFVLKRLKNIDRFERFKREIEAGRSLKHPLIAPIIDYSLEKPAFFVTPKYPGPLLEEYAPVQPLEALLLFIALCEAVAYAHSKGVFHRDLKPENIILDEEQSPVILDFGLCYFDDGTRLTTTMEQVGSRFYMAPELEAGRSDKVSAQVDSYALGKILYYLLSGKHLAREGYTGDGDLTKVLQDPQMDYVTSRILAKSVRVIPSDRLPPKKLGEEARKVLRLIQEHFYPGREGSRCRFCGEGTYDRMPITTLRVRQPGIEHDVRLSPLVCKNCGNIQWFITGEE